jgi:D-amino-acid oxidase
MTDAARRSNDFYASFLNAGVGVAPRTVFILANSPDLDPDIAPWGPSYGGIAPIPRDEVPVNFAYGWSFQTMLVDVRSFFPYLMNRVLAGGTTITLRTVATRADLLALPHPIIANCTGLGARDLLGDQAVYPFKGQLVLVNPIPLDKLVVHGNDYLFPRGDQAILGGTNEAHIEDATPSEEVTRGIIERNKSVLPSLSRGDVIEVRAGLRPFREGGPRVEAETVGDKLLLHDYGHGGGGWTLAPGCAELLFHLMTAVG